MLKDEAFYFVRLGTFLERADNTARLLDVKYHGLAAEAQMMAAARGDDAIDTSSRLLSLGGRAAIGVGVRDYRKVYRDVIAPSRVAELLILRRRHAALAARLA